MKNQSIRSLPRNFDSPKIENVHLVPFHFHNQTQSSLLPQSQILSSNSQSKKIVTCQRVFK